MSQLTTGNKLSTAFFTHWNILYPFFFCGLGKTFIPTLVKTQEKRLLVFPHCVDLCLKTIRMIFIFDMCFTLYSRIHVFHLYNHNQLNDGRKPSRAQGKSRTICMLLSDLPTYCELFTEQSQLGENSFVHVHYNIVFPSLFPFLDWSEAVTF